MLSQWMVLMAIGFACLLQADAYVHENNKNVLIPSLMFGLHLPLILVVIGLYYLVLKPFVQRKMIAAGGTPGFKQHKVAPSHDPNRPKTPGPSVSTTNVGVSEADVPSYWTKNKDPIRIINITNDCDFIKKLVYNLWQPQEVGIGRDTESMEGYNYLNITKVQRIENVHLYREYDKRRQGLTKKEGKVNYFPTLEDRSSSPVRTTDYIKKKVNDCVLEKEIDHSINEHLLFHGTLPQNVDSICRTGLSTYYVSRALFGEGVYFAENPTKSNQYTDDTSQQAIVHKGRKLLLVRVCLGELYIQKDGPSSYLKSPPCRTCYKHQCPDHPYTFDCAVGDVPGLRFREFVVYRDYRAYPEYIITYDRVKSDKNMKEFMTD